MEQLSALKFTIIAIFMQKIREFLMIDFNELLKESRTQKEFICWFFSPSTQIPNIIGYRGIVFYILKMTKKPAFLNNCSIVHFWNWINVHWEKVEKNLKWIFSKEFAALLFGPAYEIALRTPDKLIAFHLEQHQFCVAKDCFKKFQCFRAFDHWFENFLACRIFAKLLTCFRVLIK